MVTFVEVLVSSVVIMWLKICYVLKNNKDKLLGYIHVPTKHDQFKEEIRWVPARNNGKNDGRLRCVTTPDLDSEEMMNENNSPFEKGGVLSYHEIDDMVCGNDSDKSHLDSCDTNNDEHTPSTKSCDEIIQIPAENNAVEQLSVVHDVDDDDDFNMKTLSISDDSIGTNEQLTNPECCELPVPTTNSECQNQSVRRDIENQRNKDDRGPKQLTVEIRYKPNSKNPVTNRRKTKRTKDEREVLSAINHESNKQSPSGNREENNGEHKENDDEDQDITDEDSRFLELEKMSCNNKIRFIYRKGEDDSEDIFRVPSRLPEDSFSVPSRQEEFNNGIRQHSSSPKKEKNEKKKKQTKNTKLSTRKDATFTVPCNSTELKEIIYRQWLSRKRRQAKNEAYMKSLEEKRRSREEELQSNTRRLASESEFEAWNTSKTEEILSEKVKEKKRQKQSEKEKLETSLQKAKEAEKYYARWKRAKDENIRKAKLQQRREERERNKEQCKQRRELSEESLKAFTTWKSQKARAEAASKKKEEEEKAKQGEEKLRQFEKRQEALRIYEQWKNRTKKKSPHSSPMVNQGETADAGVIIPIISDVTISKPKVTKETELPDKSNAETKVIADDEMNENRAYHADPDPALESPKKKIKVHVTRLHRLRATLSKKKRRGSFNSTFIKDRSLNSSVIKNRSFRSTQDAKRKQKQYGSSTQQQQAWNVIYCMKSSKENDVTSNAGKEQKKDGINVFYKDVLPSDQCSGSPTRTYVFPANNTLNGVTRCAPKIIKPVNKPAKKQNFERPNTKQRTHKTKDDVVGKEKCKEKAKPGYETKPNDSHKACSGISSQKKAKIDSKRFVVTKDFQEIFDSNEKDQDKISVKYDELKDKLVLKFANGREEIISVTTPTCTEQTPHSYIMHQSGITKETEENKSKICVHSKKPLNPNEVVQRRSRIFSTRNSGESKSHVSGFTAPPSIQRKIRKDAEEHMKIKDTRSRSKSKDRVPRPKNQKNVTNGLDVPNSNTVQDFDTETLKVRSLQNVPELSNATADKWICPEEIDSAIFHSCEEPSENIDYGTKNETDDCKETAELDIVQNNSKDSKNEKDRENAKVEIEIDDTNVIKNSKTKAESKDINLSESSWTSKDIKRKNARKGKKNDICIDLKDTDVTKGADDLKNKKNTENTMTSKYAKKNSEDKKITTDTKDKKMMKPFSIKNDTNITKKSIFEANRRIKIKNHPKYTKNDGTKKDRCPTKGSNNNPNSDFPEQKKDHLNSKPRQADEKNSNRIPNSTDQKRNIRLRKTKERPANKEKQEKQQENMEENKSAEADNTEKKSNKWNQRAMRLRQFLEKWRPAMDYVTVDEMRNTTDRLWNVIFYQKDEEPSCEYVGTNRITGEVESSLEKKNRAWSIAFCPKKKKKSHYEKKSDGNRKEKKPIIEETIQVQDIDMLGTLPEPTTFAPVSDKKSKSMMPLPDGFSKSVASKTTCASNISNHTSNPTPLNAGDRILQIISPIFSRTGILNHYNKYSRSSTLISSSSTPTLTNPSGITNSSNAANEQIDEKNHIDPDTSFLQPTFSSNAKRRTPPSKTQTNLPKSIANEITNIKSQGKSTSRFARAMAKLKLTRMISSRYGISMKQSENKCQDAKDKHQTQIQDGHTGAQTICTHNNERSNLSACEDDTDDEDSRLIENRKKKLIVCYSAVRVLVILFLLYYVQQNMEVVLLSSIETCSKLLSEWSMGVSESLKLLKSKSLSSLAPPIGMQYNMSLAST